MSYPASAGPAGVVLLRPNFNSTERMAEGVEFDLKRRIAAWREGNGWSTVKKLFSMFCDSFSPLYVSRLIPVFGFSFFVVGSSRLSLVT